MGVGLPRSLWGPSLAALSITGFTLGGLLADKTPASRVAAVAAVAGAAIALGALLERRAQRPLGTAANVLNAMRHGDYLHRARTDVVAPAVAGLLEEVNQLAGHLELERRRAEESAALLDSLIQRMDVALLAFDESDHLVWWNPAAQRLFRARLREGATAQHLGAVELLCGAGDRSVTLGESVNAPGEWELRRGPFHRAGRRYQFLMLTSAQRLRREQERIAWQRLVRVLGHEVNNTLAPVQSLAATCRGLLEDAAADELERVSTALQMMEHRCASLTHFIAEFSRLARLPKPKPEPLALEPLVRRVVSLEARYPVTLQAGPALRVLADAPLLEQALINLVRNAVDAVIEGRGGVRVGWIADNDRARIFVEDDGPGIANPDNLFVPLFTTKAKGNGIGLVLARDIIERHGGELRMENRVGARGCLATVHLPLVSHGDQRALNAREGVTDAATRAGNTAANVPTTATPAATTA